MHARHKTYHKTYKLLGHSIHIRIQLEWLGYQHQMSSWINQLVHHQSMIPLEREKLGS